MKRIVAIAAALLVSFPALAGASEAAAKKTAAPAAPAAHGKPSAPVTVSARVGTGRATVTVRFHSAATDAAVEVHGVDGLVVTSAATPLSGGRFTRGETVAFDVSFTEGAEPGQLAVVVTGTFASGKRITSASFASRPPTREQLKPARNATTDSTGRRITVMPAEPR